MIQVIIRGPVGSGKSLVASTVRHSLKYMKIKPSEILDTEGAVMPKPSSDYKAHIHQEQTE